MAGFDVDFPDDFLSGLLETDFDEICKEALNETGKIFEKEMKKTAKETILHSGESEMVASIKTSKPIKVKTGGWKVNVSPTGNSVKKEYYGTDGRGRKTRRKYKVSNKLKAIWKEYGIAGRQAARPFISTATNNVKSEVMGKIQEIYDRKVGGG